MSVEARELYEWTTLAMVYSSHKYARFLPVITEQGKFKDAEPFFELCITVAEQSLGQDHLNVASVPNGLAVSSEKEVKA